ncbi:MAG: glycogen synthase [Candidatus Kerfeldbacteria bacterium]|nr:glycogen synthase [Candidatus Kerfeldbacteria bacterium]
MTNALSVVNVASELAPLAKSGGLGDVAAALPKHMLDLGQKVTSILPMYSFLHHRRKEFERIGDVVIRIGYKRYPAEFYQTSQGDLPVALIWNEELFSCKTLYGCDNDNLRFYFFNLATLALLELKDVKPHIIHCHDWQAGLIPNLLRCYHSHDERYGRTATVYTIHNLQFQMQGGWRAVPEEKRDDGRGEPPSDLWRIRRLNFAARAIRYATVINAVSERYAKEILTPDFGEGLDPLLRRRRRDVYGIINGIDYQVFNPAFDHNIWYQYDWHSLEKKKRNKRKLQQFVGLEVKPDTPVIGLVHRLTEQKGFDLLKLLIPSLLKLPLQIVIVGTGGKDYLKFFQDVAKKYPRRVGVYSPFTEELGAKVYAGSDMFLMPSRFEPCGISQLISLRYGSIPIVHETGGLSDTISNFNPRTMKGNGFVFSSYTPEDLLIAIIRALETFKYGAVWNELTAEAMRRSYSWDLPSKKYLQLYRKALRLRRNH